MGSYYYSNVQKALNQLDNSALKEFASYQNDVHRYECVRRMPAIADAFILSAKPRFDRKSAKESVRLREEGNDAFRNRNYPRAVDLYTRSILYAPYPDVVDGKASSPSSSFLESSTASAAGKDDKPVCCHLALSLGNRSAALFQQQRWEEALDDIREAFRHSYPPAAAYKLLGRQARALCELGRHEEARATYGQVRLALNDASDLLGERREEFTRDVERHLEECAKSHVAKAATVIGCSSGTAATISNGAVPHVVVTSPDAAVTVVAHDTTSSVTSSQLVPRVALKNREYAGASDAFSVQYTPSKGRHGIAARDVSVGEYVIVEMPHACVLDPGQHAQRCYHCFTPLRGLGLACQQCATARYCTDECRIASWKAYHRVECSILGALLASDTGCISLLITRLLLITDVNVVVRLADLSLKKMGFARSADGGDITDIPRGLEGGFASVYGLLSHTKLRPVSDLLQYTLLAIFIVQLLRHTTPYKDIDAGSEIKVGGAVLKLLQVASCNAVEVTEVSLPASSKLAPTVGSTHKTSPSSSPSLASSGTDVNIQQLEPATIGLGLYPTVSLLNHSCHPALELIFHGNVCAVRAIRPLPAGAELTIDYGYLFYSTERSQRQQSLRARYYFDCSCEACVGGWQLKSRLKSDIPTLKCQKCGAASRSDPGFTGGGVKAEMIGSNICPGCGQATPTLADVIEDINSVRVAGEKAMGEARLWHLDAAVDALQATIARMDGLIACPWKDYVVCLSMLKQCYRVAGNRSPHLHLPDNARGR